MSFVYTCTAENTVISPNFLVCKFCGKGKFPHNFGQIAQNYAETVPFHKISAPGNSVKIPSFLFINDFSSQSHFSQMPYNKLELLGRGYLPKETFVNKELDIFIGWWGRRSNSCYVLLKMLICLLISWFLPLTNVSNVFRLASKTLI